MRERIQVNNLTVARVLVWSVLAGSLLAWIRWGSEVVSITSFYRIRHSVPYIWRQFLKGLPDVGNPRALEVLYWISIVVLIAGVLALLWLALEPRPFRPTEPEPPEDPRIQ